MSALLACSSTSKQKQLESVAKDWSMTIRASQVMPVYPLTEDLQPGDIFLVQLPITRQQDLWRKKGFLPLDNHVGRLDPSHYPEFYDHSFLIKAEPDVDKWLPGEWRGTTPASAGADGSAPLPAWSSAPRSAFPSYSFSVRQSTGIDLAIPVSGVPVGLGLLGSDAADGTV